MTHAPRYLIGAYEIDPDTEAGQDTLALAHASRERVICDCSAHRPEMYVARAEARYILKRMPETGPLHAPDCISYEPPEGFSGRGPLQGTAIVPSEEDDSVALRLDFALSKGAPRPPPPGGGGTATEVEASQRKLGLTALLHYLWEEAALNRWVPGMEGKRNWRNVRGALLGAAQNRFVKGRLPLTSRLFVPEAYSHNYRSQIAERRAERLAALTEASARDYGILIAEYKSHEPTRLGARFTFKHLPDMPFFADEDFLRRFESVSAVPLGLCDMAVNGHLITIATFGFSQAGYPVLHQMGFMAVTARWLPMESWQDARLIEVMCEDHRSFRKSLRYNVDPATELCSILATDTEEPVLMFVNSDAPEGDTGGPLIQDGFLRWDWPHDTAMPALPPRRRYQDRREA